LARALRREEVVKRAAIVFLVLAQAAIVEAQTGRAAQTDRATLTGLKAVSVLVENIDKDAERAGFSGGQIKTDVELRLRKAGVRVVETTNYAFPYLYINLNTLQLSNFPTWIYSLRVGLVQTVTLPREKPFFCVAETWNRGSLGFAPAGTLVSSARSQLGDLVDQFINDFLAANQ
jgi:hypothetical protein